MKAILLAFISVFWLAGCGRNSSFVKLQAPENSSGVVVPVKTLITGDVNGDGCVNIVDLTTAASHWLKTQATLSEGDVNYDGVVNIEDHTEIAAHWLEGCAN